MGQTVDTSIYNNLQQPNAMAGMKNAYDLANTAQQNKLYQTANQEQQVNLQNSLYQQQAGQMQAMHTMPDGRIDFVGWAADPNFKQNPYAAQKLNDNLLNSGQQTSYMTNEGGIPTTKYGSKQDVATANNPKTPVNQADDEVMQDTAGAMPDAQMHYDRLNTNINRINTLLNKPVVNNKDVLNTSVDLHGDGSLTAPEAANFVTSLTTPDGKPVDKQAVLQAAAPAGQARRQLVQHVASSKPPINSNPVSGSDMNPSIPAGYTSPLPESAKTYQTVKADAENIPQQLAAYNEVINLNNAGAKTGTSLAQMYKYVAQKVPGLSDAVTDKAAQTQAIGKYLSQGLIAGGMPTSDARLQELQSGNLNPDQLPETIKKLAPFFKASAQGAIDKQTFYNTKTNNGKDLTQEPAASQQWNQNYDPRWKEFDALPSNSEKASFLKEHPDMIANKQKYKNLKDMGVVDGYPGMK